MYWIYFLQSWSIYPTPAFCKCACPGQEALQVEIRQICEVFRFHLRNVFILWREKAPSSSFSSPSWRHLACSHLRWWHLTEVGRGKRAGTGWDRNTKYKKKIELPIWVNWLLTALPAQISASNFHDLTQITQRRVRFNPKLTVFLCALG